MGWININGLWISRHSGQSYWHNLISATVENAAPANVVLTFPEAKPELTDTDFTCTVNGVARAVSSASWTGAELTLVLASAVVYGDVVIVTFVKSGGTKTITNNVLYTMLLSSTGTGAGVSTLRMEVSADITVTLGANAKFYTDAGGTTGESDTWTITSGAIRTIYLKATSGDSLMTFSDASKITTWGNDSTDGWISSTNAAKVTARLNVLGITKLRLIGTSTLQGAMPTGLTILVLSGASISWTYTGALPTGLTILVLSGASISWTYTGVMPTGLTYLYLNGASISWTYNGALPIGLKTLLLNGASISWTYNGALPIGLTTLLLNGASIDWTGLSIGNNGNITTLNLANYRVSKMSSADMVTLLTQMTNRAGSLPASITINDYQDYSSPPQAVIDAVNLLKTEKNVTSVVLGA